MNAMASQILKSYMHATMLSMAQLHFCVDETNEN